MSTELLDDLLEALKSTGNAGLKELLDYLKTRSTVFVKETKDPALTLGKQLASALLFDEAVQLYPPAASLTTEQLQELTLDQMLARAKIQEKRAEQRAIILAIEAERQESAAIFREKTKLFINDILKTAGQIGLKILISALVAL